MRAAFALTIALFGGGAAGAELTLASWNLSWLRSAPLSDADYQSCRALKPKQREQLDELHPMRWVCRDTARYRQLKTIAAQLAADVISVQEVEDNEALGRVFPSEEYDLYVNARSPWIQRTGFAVRKGRADVVGFNDYAALAQAFPHHARSGAELVIKQSNGRLLYLLSVHLKSGCFDKKLTDDYATKRDREEGIETCHVLGQQVPALEAWIDQHTADGHDWMVIGDFNRRFDAPLEKSKTARDETGQTIAIFPELNDNEPPGAKLYRVTWGREQIDACREGSRHFIDHVIFKGSMRPRVRAESFEQLPLPKLPRRDRAELSDHCPIRVSVDWQ